MWDIESHFYRQILNQTSSRQTMHGRWVFLGTDGWGKKSYPVKNFGRAAMNAITIAPMLYPITGSCCVDKTLSIYMNL